MACSHVYQPQGKYYSRSKHWLLNGETFTVVRLRKCEHCDKVERKVVMKKRVISSPDAYEKHLKFSGIKPERHLN